MNDIFKGFSINPSYDPNDSKSNRWIPGTGAPVASPFAAAPVVSPFSNVPANGASPFAKPNLDAVKSAVAAAPGGQTPVPAAGGAPKDQGTGIVTPKVTETAKPDLNAGGNKTATVIGYKDNPDGTTTHFLSDGTTDTVRLQLNPDGSYTPTPVNQGGGLPTNPDGSVDTATLARQAGAAGMSMADYIKLVQTQAGGSAVQNNIRAGLGIDAAATTAFQKPSQTTQQIYTDAYNAEKLGDIQKSIKTIDDTIAQKRRDLNKVIGEQNDNPWLSEATRNGRIARAKELATADIQTYIDQRASTLEQYNMGVDQIEKMVTRISNDTKLERDLNTDKLNYLLNEAERQNKASEADAAAGAVRGGTGAFLRGVQDKEDRALQNDIKKEQAKNSAAIGTTMTTALAKNPGAAPYYSAFNNIIGTKQLSEFQFKNAAATLNSYLVTGDNQGARDYLRSMAKGALPTEIGKQVYERGRAIDALTNLKSDIASYVSKYGDTNILTGSIQNIQQKLGTAGNPDAVALNQKMTNYLQLARNAITGAAWGAQENAEYNKVTPALTNTSALNLALIDSTLDTLNGYNQSDLGQVITPDVYQALYGNSGAKTTKGAVLDSLVAGSGGSSTSVVDPEMDALLQGSLINAQ